MNRKKIILKTNLLLLGMTFLGMSCRFSFAQETVNTEDEVFVIETGLDIEQSSFAEDTEIILPQESPPMKPMANLGETGLSTEYQESMQRHKDGLNEEQIILLNRSLKRLIEENEELLKQNNALDRQLRNIRGQRTIETNRLENLTQERDGYKERMEEITGLKEQIEKDVLDYKDRQKGREKWLEEKIADLEGQLAQAEETIQRGSLLGYHKVFDKKDKRQAELLEAIEILESDKIFEKAERSKEEVISMIENINKKKERLRIDEAKIHYNMGNVLFKRGQYSKAIKEYKKALSLTPHDANAHFNLALISSDYMRDYKAAAKHYREYLILNPEAEDENLVREKIIEAEMYIKSYIPSSMEDDVKRNDTFYVQ